MNPESKRIVNQICDTLNISSERVLSKSRTREASEARFLCLHFIKLKNASVSFNTVGKWFNRSGNGSAHAFAIYGIKQVAILNEVSDSFKQKYQRCLSDLNFYNSTINFNNIPQY